MLLDDAGNDIFHIKARFGTHGYAIFFIEARAWFPLDP